MNAQLTKEQILNHICTRIFEQGGRASSKGLCRLEVNGKYCAFSICLSNEGRENMASRSSSGSVRSVPDYVIESVLLPEFRGHSLEFWADVQLLHDVASYWDERNMLNEDGIKFYNKILENNKILEKHKGK